MGKKYSEIIIEGSFMLAKGFLLGFLSTSQDHGKYFFHRKSGIRRETFRELLKDFFELDNHVHVCLEQPLVDKFKKASSLYTEITGNKIVSEKPIKSASFHFSYEFFNQDLAKQAKDILNKLPEGVSLTDYFPFEEHAEEGHGVESYAPLHEFTTRARGKLSGDFEGIMTLYLNIKKSNLSESIICDEVLLNFE